MVGLRHEHIVLRQPRRVGQPLHERPRPVQHPVALRASREYPSCSAPFAALLDPLSQ